MKGNHKAMAAALQKHGRKGDTVLAHISPEEAALLDRITDGGSVNPKTGLPEFFGSEYGGGDRGGDNGNIGFEQDMENDFRDLVDSAMTGGRQREIGYGDNEEFSYGPFDTDPGGPGVGFNPSYDLDSLEKSIARQKEFDDDPQGRSKYKGTDGRAYNNLKDVWDSNAPLQDYLSVGAQEIGPNILGGLGGIAGLAFGGPAGAMALGGLGKYAGGASPQNAIASGIFGGFPGVNLLAQLASGYIAGEAADKVGRYAGGLPTNPDRPAPGTAPVGGQQFADDQGRGGGGSPSVATSNNFGVTTAPTPSSSGASGAGFTPTSGPFSVPGYTSGGVLGKKSKGFGLGSVLANIGSPYGRV